MENWAVNLLKNPWRPRLVRLLVAVNLAGAVYGFWWYRLQLAGTPASLWFFTADCPVYGTFFALLLVLWLARERLPKLLLLLACTGLIKYGTWYSLAMFNHWVQGNSLDWLIWLQVAAHLAMVAQGLVFLVQSRYTLAQWAVNTLWLLANDALDYGLAIYPWLPQGCLLVFCAIWRWACPLAWHCCC